VQCCTEPTWELAVVVVSSAEHKPYIAKPQLTGSHDMQRSHQPVMPATYQALQTIVLNVLAAKKPHGSIFRKYMVIGAWL
jgi:hypothetical protein